MFESLERREVLSTATPTATFVPFATLPGQVSTPGQTAEVTLHFSAGQITSSKSSTVLVGFYAESTSGSAAAPEITEVDGLSGSLSRVSLPKRGGLSPSKSLFITYLQTSTTSAQDVTVKVVEPSKQVGSFALEAFLPGDANADNTVDGVDIALVQRAYGTAAGQPNNNLAADFNADGHVGCIDLRLTEMNQGAHVTYGSTPTIPAPVPAGSILTPVATPPAVAPASAVLSTPAALLKPTVVIAPAATTTTSATTTTTASAASAAAVAPAASAAASAATATTTTSATTTATTAPVATTSATTAPALVPVVEYVPVLTYAYSQPGVAVPAVAPASTVTTSLAPSPVYYYGQPVVGFPASVPASAPASAADVPIPASSMPVYYLPQAPASASATSSSKAG